MDEPIIELTPEWIELNALKKKATMLGIYISSDITVSELRVLIANKENEIFWENNNLLNRP